MAYPGILVKQQSAHNKQHFRQNRCPNPNFKPALNFLQFMTKIFTLSRALQTTSKHSFIVDREREKESGRSRGEGQSILAS